MLLRAAIVFLLVLNIGIAAWWLSGGNAAPGPAAAPVPANEPGLRLLSEIPAPKPVAAPSSPAVASMATAQVPGETVVAAQCLRFGPFANGPSRDAARASLSAAGIAAVPRDTAARSGRGWKVHVPSFASREEAKAMGERIKAAGISDWYVMNDGGDANSVALGRYGSEEAARRREAELKAKGIPAQAEPLGDTTAQAWLDARLPADANRAALAAIAPSKPVDCASLP
jgi:cell division septation protein DedD